MFLYYSKAIKKGFTLSFLTLKANCNGRETSRMVRRRQCLSGPVYYFVHILCWWNLSSISWRWSPIHFTQVCNRVSPRGGVTSGLQGRTLPSSLRNVQSPWWDKILHSFFFIYWSIVDLQCFRYTAKWFSYTYISILFQILFYSRLLQDTEYSPLCLTVGPCWLSIWYIVACIC